MFNISLFGKQKKFSKYIKKHFLYILLCSLSIVLIASSCVVFFQSRQRAKILSECVIHKILSSSHYHTQLYLERDGQQVMIPANVGIRIYKDRICMHPFHTHDDTGLIHIDYPQTTHFTLGEFFDVLGLILTDNQIGDAKTSERYKITVFVNEKEIKNNYRDIVLRDREVIKIIVTSI